jgi:phosphoglycolate phosphatase
VYDLLIFDLDGTLVDTAPDIARALNATLTEAGLPTHSTEAVIRMVGDGVIQLVERAVGAAGEGRVKELAVRFRERYIAQPIVDTKPFPGVAETMAALSRFTKAVATNKPGCLARAILAELGLAKYFIAVLGEDDVAQRKPSPEGVDRLRAMAGTARQRTLFVGDSPVDAATAEAAGIDVCLATYGYGDPAALGSLPARFRIERFEQLPKLLS